MRYTVQAARSARPRHAQTARSKGVCSTSRAKLACPHTTFSTRAAGTSGAPLASRLVPTDAARLDQVRDLALQVAALAGEVVPVVAEVLVQEGRLREVLREGVDEHVPGRNPEQLVASV